MIDEQALIKAIQSGKTAGAALDVFEKEPIEPNNPLLKFENVILSPHNATNKDKVIETVTKNTIDMLIEELDKSENNYDWRGYHCGSRRDFFCQLEKKKKIFLLLMRST